MRECCGNPLKGCRNCPPYVPDDIPPTKKLTFEEWFNTRFNKHYGSRFEIPGGSYLDEFALEIWKAAQENV